MRCLTLAERLHRDGWRCVFVCTPKILETIPAINAANVDVRMIDLDLWGAADAVRAALPEGCEALIVDDYSIDRSFEAKCRPWAKQIMVIDDLADRHHDCDVLIDQTAGRVVEHYRELIPEGSTLLLGSEYALLRQEFVYMRGASAQRRQQSVEPKRILVTLGLTDAVNATSKVLAGLELSSVNAEIDVALGSSAPHLDKVRAQIETMKTPARLHVDHPRVADLMAQADLSIGAAGSTSWERCCLGLPCMMVVTADNQVEIARSLEARGAAMLLGRVDALAVDEMAARIREVWLDGKALGIMSTNAMAICDGLGADRVVEVFNDKV